MKKEKDEDEEEEEESLVRGGNSYRLAATNECTKIMVKIQSMYETRTHTHTEREKENWWRRQQE
jgi:hypothetical protein